MHLTFHKASNRIGILFYLSIIAVLLQLLILADICFLKPTGQIIKKIMNLQQISIPHRSGKHPSCLNNTFNYANETANWEGRKFVAVAFRKRQMWIFSANEVSKTPVLEQSQPTVACDKLTYCEGGVCMFWSTLLSNVACIVLPRQSCSYTKP